MTPSQPTASASPVPASMALARGGATPARTSRPGLAGPQGGWARAFLREGL